MVEHAPGAAHLALVELALAQPGLRGTEILAGAPQAREQGLALARDGAAFLGDEPLALALELRLARAGGGGLALRVGASELERAALVVEALDHLVERDRLAREEPLGALEHGPGHAEAARHGEGARRARDADGELERRAHRGEIEADRRVLEPGIAEGERLEAVVVRGAGDGAAARAERVEHGDGEGLSLARIRSAGELVEEDEDAGVRGVEDRREVLDMSAEGGEVLAEVLVVADVGEHEIDGRHPRAVGGGHGQPRPDHERGEAERLQRHRLAPGVGAGDDHGAAGADGEIARHHRDAVELEERVSGGDEVDRRVARREQLREGEAQLLRELGRGGAEIGVRERVGGGREPVDVLGDLRRERDVDGLLLAGDLAVEHLLPVAHRDDGPRLHEEGGAAVARCVDDAGEPLVGVGADGEHVAPVALGPEAVLEDAFVLADELVEPTDQPVARGAPLGPELAEVRRGAIRQGPVGVERARELALQVVERGIGRARSVERGHGRPARLQEAAQRAGGAEARRDRPDLLVRERRADAGPIDGVLDVAEPEEGQRLGRRVERGRLARLGERGGDRLGARREGERPRGALAGSVDAAIGERLEQAIPLEIAARLVGAGVGELGHGLRRGER